MRVSELAKRTGLTVDTIRFYEKRGLIDREHLSRRENGYRDYHETVLGRLDLVKRAKSMGFSLTEIGRSITEWETDRLSPEAKERAFRDKITLIDTRIAELEEMKAYLREKLATMIDPLRVFGPG